MFKSTFGLIKEADTMESLGLHFENEDASPIVVNKYYAIVPFAENTSIDSHWNLLDSIRNSVKYGIDLKEFKIKVIGGITKFNNDLDTAVELEKKDKDSDAVAKWFMDMKQCRVWKNEEIFTTWSPVDDFKKSEFNLIEKALKFLGSSVSRYRFHSSSPVTPVPYETKYDLMVWEEFTNYVPEYLEEREREIRQQEADLMRMAHLFPHAKYRKEILKGKRFRESYIQESPDGYTSKESPNKSCYWEDSGNITFIVDGSGNYIITKEGTHRHAQVSLKLKNQDPEEFQQQNDLTNGQMKAITRIYNNLEYGGKEKSSIVENILELGSQPIRFRLDLFALGRIFPDCGVVSLWNSKSDLTNSQISAILRLVKREGFLPRETTFEIYDHKKSDFVELTNKDFFDLRSNTLKDKEKISPYDLTPKQAQAHIEPDPIKRKNLQRELGMNRIKGKVKYPPEYRMLIRQESFKYHAFDWDDNLFYMPSTVEVESKDGQKLKISTEQYSNFKRNKNNLLVEDTNYIKLAENAYSEFRAEHDPKFLEDCRNAKTGPAWNIFVEAVNGGNIFSIVTARGHAPETLATTIHTLLSENFEGLNKEECIKSLREMHQNSNSKKTLNDSQLLDRYIFNLCKYYPVCYEKNLEEIDVSEEKGKYLKEFKSYVEGTFGGMSLEFRNNVSNTFIIEYTDDDLNNLDYVYENSKFDELVILATNKGILREYSPE